MSRITFDPSIPLSLWFPLLLAAGALLTWYAWSSRRRLAGRRRMAILFLMGVAFALPLAILLNPTWTEPIPPPPGKPLLTILVDQSASMNVRDPATGRSRYEEAVASVTEAAQRFEPEYEVRLFGFDRELKNTNPDDLSVHEPEGTSTDLAAALEQALDSEQPQGQFLLLFSDGVHNHGSTARIRESLTKAKTMAVPIFTHTLTGTAEIEDLELSLGLPQEIAFAAQQVPVTVSVRRRGNTTAAARMSLRLDGQTLQEREIEIPGNETVETSWTLMQPQSGLYRYEISVEPLPGEVTVVNNTATLLLRVVDEPVRILLLEGKPYWDTKYLVRTLSADPSIELTCVVRVAEGRLHRRRIFPVSQNVQEGIQADVSSSGQNVEQRDTRQGGPSVKKDDWTIETQADRFLDDPGELDRYQVVVLGRDAEIFLSDTALVRLKKWLTEGTGSLVCFRGSPTSQINERLGQLLPMRWEPSQESRFRLQMTSAGQALGWLPESRGAVDDPLPEMPSLASVTRPGTPKPLAVVLAASDEKGESVPLITYQPVGNGRTVVVEGAGMWRWAFLPPTYQDRDEIYAALWRSLVRWLVSHVGLLPSQELALRTDTTTFSVDEIATAILLVREDRIGEVPTVELSGDGLGQSRQVSPVPTGEPGQYRLVFGRLPEGHYRAKILATQGSDTPSGDVAGLAEFDVRGNLRERLDITPQPELMRDIARDTGGAELSGSDWSDLERHFRNHLTRIHPPRNTQTPIWDRWWVLLGTVVFWACSWMLRRVSGLV